MLGWISGLTLWQLRVLLGKRDSTPPYLLRDSIRNSVFVTGFGLRNVQNPALVSLAQNPQVVETAGSCDTKSEAGIHKGLKPPGLSDRNLRG